MTVLHLMRMPEVALEAIGNDDAWREDVQARLAKVEDCEVVLLVTFVPAGRKQSFKAHPLEVVQLQARALGLPHAVLEISSAPTFLDSYRANINHLREQYGITALATGDILDVCNSFMPRAAAGTGVDLICPLWGIERGLLLELIWAYGMKPLITCVNVTKFEPAAQRATAAMAVQLSAAQQAGFTLSGGEMQLGACGGGFGGSGAGVDGGGLASGIGMRVGDGTALLGRQLDRDLYNEALLPAKEVYGVDECGEWGEFHTMVTDSRLFGGGPLRLSFKCLREGDYAFLSLSASEERTDAS
ncbi:hypothetical protein VOLCADRAFT_105972 [Volvox carteri f. nagariensis]|uniref:Diphthine--ammonia ligase n=1 Tax=Volvox carteri f. nagariensis TaxID=3068 RepID=D8U421_VOLCA|nr:uncharacterized protein VOLCADRAFT_105972 [Volvox carteri f. nagariensis]EFJ45422.1 hypothetical protein VOLCADRAFT_105972 [Volvox carteri f. nagariensis]|eukprot:XP_002953449.1 hypothetical protein VOLCADRAFT_105972 [Volvox carteri f. nagariensis]